VLTRSNIGYGQGTTYYNQPVNNHADASFNWATAAADIQSYSYDNAKNTLSSLFGRLTYDYKERYLLTAIVRRDGSSKFGSDKNTVFPIILNGLEREQRTILERKQLRKPT
jgi:hypothetical protein